MNFFWILIQALLCFLPLQLALEVSGSEQNSSPVDTLPLGRLDSEQLRELQSVLPCWIQVGSDINGETAGDWFGRSVAMSDDGRRVVVGASGHGSGSGHVRVLEYNTSSGAWIQVGSDIDGESAGDRSGVSVAISEDGSRVAVGAPKNNGSNGVESGHVRIFDYNASSGAWIQVGSDIDGESAGDWFGFSVQMSDDGSRIAVGAWKNDGSNGNTSGHVRVFDYDTSSGAWIQVGSDIDGEASEDRSGYSVAMSEDGSRVAVGAFDSDDGGNNSGHVRVFDYDTSSGAWIQVGNDIIGEASDDYFGRSVQMSDDGTRVAIGAILNDGSNGNTSGHVRVFDYDTSSGDWIQVGSDIDGEAKDDHFGYGLAMSDDGARIVVGAWLNDGSAGVDSGHVRVFDYDTSSGAWIQVGSDIDGEMAGDRSGFSVAMSDDGTRVAISAFYNDANGESAGHVRVYTPSFDDCVNTPSAAPSTSPSAAPTTGCFDTDGKFTVGTGNDKGCGWLKAKDVRKARHCGTTEVQSICPSTCCDCGMCPTSRPTPAPTPAPVSLAPTAPSKGGKGGKGTKKVLRGGLNQH